MQIQNRSLPIMLETKEPNKPDCVRVITGVIEACGRVKDNDRGTER